ncbi:MAG TPA: hypothetical protein VHV47_00315 [Opitutaceae bacterium]|jgi:predicted LPLAT superfamily acyltransferase|nr:hypothetical protein [Opitutaceae bacterium]
MELTPARPPAPRNPGPSWGLGFLRRADALLPRPLFDFLLGAGTAVAVAAMPAARRHSRDYLTAALGRPAGWSDLWRHFHAFARTMMVALRVSGGAPYRCVDAPGNGDFHSLAASGRPALYGTFHLGESDLLGFALARFRQRVCMIRLRMESSPELEDLARRFGGGISFLWVNEPSELLFALKEAAQSGASIALKCDRLGHASRTEAFDFLGERRLFPFTIYHLAEIFHLPVMLSASVSAGPGEARVHCSPLFEPGGGGRAENLARARAHFQGFLGLVEGLLRRDPYLWFNFGPLNPAASSAPRP